MNIEEDIENREHVEIIVDNFYLKVRNDDLLSPIFDNADVNWATHLKTMYNFWDSMLFYSGKYSGNPLKVHLELNKEQPLSKKHFDRWIELFTTNVDELYQGRNSETLKNKAKLIYEMMLLKIENYNKENNIYDNQG